MLNHQKELEDVDANESLRRIKQLNEFAIKQSELNAERDLRRCKS